MDVQIEYVLVVIILEIMAWLMRIRKLDILISRYESFQKLIRRRSFTVDKAGVANYYSYLFAFSGLSVFLSLFIDTSKFVSWIVIAFFVIIASGVLYLNIGKKYLVFEE